MGVWFVARDESRESAGRKVLDFVKAVPMLAMLAIATRPRRAPSLRRVSRKAALQPNRAAAGTWVEGQFQLIESAVPWLDRAGLTVYDHCELSRAERGWITQHSDPWYVTCTREATAVYGMNGDPAAMLTDVAAALDAVGWRGYQDPNPVFRLRELLMASLQAQGFSDDNLSWEPRVGVQPPPGWRVLEPPLAPTPYVSLDIHAESREITESDPARDDYLPPLKRRWNDLPPVTSRLDHPVEWTEPDAMALAEQVFAHSDYVLAIRINIAYFEGRY